MQSVLGKLPTSDSLMCQKALLYIPVCEKWEVRLMFGYSLEPATIERVPKRKAIWPFSALSACAVLLLERCWEKGCCCSFCAKVLIWMGKVCLLCEHRKWESPLYGGECTLLYTGHIDQCPCANLQKAALHRRPSLLTWTLATVKNSCAAKKCWQEDVSSATFTLPSQTYKRSYAFPWHSMSMSLSFRVPFFAK